MADIKFECPECKQHLVVDAGYAGSEIPCPTCNKSVTVPNANIQNTTSVLEYAGLGRRFAAGFVDYWAVVFLIFISTTCLQAIIGDGMLVILLSVYLLNWIYFSFLLSGSWQATLGMKLLKIRIVDGVGNRISFKRASARFFASILSALLLFVGFLIIPFNRKKQGLHDLVAGTFVLKNKPSQRPTPVLPPVGDAGSINPCPTGSRYITVQAASHHNSHARFPFLLFRRPILQLVSIVIGGIVLVLLVGALLGEIKPGGGSDVTDSVASSLPTTSFEKNDNSPRPLVDASETTRVWNQFIAIERDLNNAPPNDNVESMRAAIAGLQLLSSNSDKADPKVMELINRFINWLHNFIAFFNNASDIVQSDPNNQMLSTIPARLQTEKTMEDIMSEANSLGEYQNNLRIELQNKYQIQLDER